MAPALTSEAWIRTLDPYARSRDGNISMLAQILTDVIIGSTDPAVGRIIDHHAARMLGET